MISASKEFKEKLKSGASLVNYADIVLSDGTELHLTYKDFMIGGCQVEDKTTSGKFGVGSVIGKTLAMRIANYDERFSKYDFYNSAIHLYVAMLLDDGTVEKIRKGIYYTIVPETPGNIIEISAVDGMYRLDQDYSASTTAYPATLQAIISDACIDCGIPIGFRQFDNMNFIVSEKPEKATYRQVVSYAAQIAGYNARIDNAGYMQLIWYNSALLEQYSLTGGDFKTYLHDIVIDGGNFTDYRADMVISGGRFTDEVPEHVFRIKSLSVSTDDVQITGVKVVGDDKREALFGEAGYLIEVKNNPFVNLREQEVADYLGKRMVGMVFRPFSAQVRNNPLYEPFEVIRISDSKGNVYNSIINSVSYRIGGYTQISCLAEVPARNGSFYSSPAAEAVVEARKNAEKQLTAYDKAVQNMNQLAANAMGLYRELERQPNGSYIYYQSNKPITVDNDGVCSFVDGAVVYKSAAEGFFVSTDGGKSFSSGFDAQGNAVVNVLSAIGLTFDWAKGGTISLGGFDNKNGVIKVYDSSGNQTGLWDDGQFYIKSIDWAPRVYPRKCELWVRVVHYTSLHFYTSPIYVNNENYIVIKATKEIDTTYTIKYYIASSENEQDHPLSFSFMSDSSLVFIPVSEIIAGIGIISVYSIECNANSIEYVGNTYNMQSGQKPTESDIENVIRLIPESLGSGNNINLESGQIQAQHIDADNFYINGLKIGSSYMIFRTDIRLTKTDPVAGVYYWVGSKTIEIDLSNVALFRNVILISDDDGYVIEAAGALFDVRSQIYKYKMPDISGSKSQYRTYRIQSIEKSSITVSIRYDSSQINESKTIYVALFGIM